MKDKKNTKTVTVSKDVHAELKVHVAIKKVGITEFADRAIRNQIKKETKSVN
jgi:hypothetical protein